MKVDAARPDTRRVQILSIGNCQDRILCAEQIACTGADAFKQNRRVALRRQLNVELGQRNEAAIQLQELICFG